MCVHILLILCNAQVQFQCVLIEWLVLRIGFGWIMDAFVGVLDVDQVDLDI